MHFKAGQREFIVETQEFIYSRDIEYLTVADNSPWINSGGS